MSEFVIVQFSDPADVESSTEERVEHQRKELHAFFEQNRMEKLLKGYNADTDRYYDYFEGWFDVSFSFPDGDPQEGEDDSEHLLVWSDQQRQ